MVHRIRLPRPWHITSQGDAADQPHETWHITRSFNKPTGLDARDPLALEVDTSGLPELAGLSVRLNGQECGEVSVAENIVRHRLAAAMLHGVNRLELELQFSAPVLLELPLICLAIG